MIIAIVMVVIVFLCVIGFVTESGFTFVCKVYDHFKHPSLNDNRDQQIQTDNQELKRHARFVKAFNSQSPDRNDYKHSLSLDTASDGSSKCSNVNVAEFLSNLKDHIQEIRGQLPKVDVSFDDPPESDKPLGKSFSDNSGGKDS